MKLVKESYFLFLICPLPHSSSLGLIYALSPLLQFQGLFNHPFLSCKFRAQLCTFSFLANLWFNCPAPRNKFVMLFQRHFCSFCFSNQIISFLISYFGIFMPPPPHTHTCNSLVYFSFLLSSSPFLPYPFYFICSLLSIFPSFFPFHNSNREIRLFNILFHLFCFSLLIFFLFSLFFVLSIFFLFVLCFFFFSFLFFYIYFLFLTSLCFFTFCLFYTFFFICFHFHHFFFTFFLSFCISFALFIFIFHGVLFLFLSFFKFSLLKIISKFFLFFFCYFSSSHFFVAFLSLCIF